jgi:hypothetical protein
MARFSLLGRSATALLFSFLVAGAAAQTLTIGPGGFVTPGATVNLSYEDPARANQTIVVTITGGNPPRIEAVPIQLDGSGKGTGNWKVPTGWRKGFVNAPGCPEQIIPIGQTPPPVQQ